MVQSKASSVVDYLQELPEERRAVISTVREAVLRSLPAGYVEAMNYGMISYEIPLERYRNTYNGRPLSYVALAAQKNNYSLYLMCLCGGTEGGTRFREAYRKASKKLDMGKACVRFKRLDDLLLGAVEEFVAGMTPEAYVAWYEASRKK